MRKNKMSKELKEEIVKSILLVLAIILVGIGLAMIILGV